VPVEQELVVPVEQELVVPVEQLLLSVEQIRNREVIDSVAASRLIIIKVTPKQEPFTMELFSTLALTWRVKVL